LNLNIKIGKKKFINFFQKTFVRKINLWKFQHFFKYIICAKVAKAFLISNVVITCSGYRNWGGVTNWFNEKVMSSYHNLRGGVGDGLPTQHLLYNNITHTHKLHDSLDNCHQIFLSAPCMCGGYHLVVQQPKWPPMWNKFMNNN